MRNVGGAALVSAGMFRGVHGCVGEVHQVVVTRLKVARDQADDERVKGWIEAGKP